MGGGMGPLFQFDVCVRAGSLTGAICRRMRADEIAFKSTCAANVVPVSSLETPRFRYFVSRSKPARWRPASSSGGRPLRVDRSARPCSESGTADNAAESAASAASGGYKAENGSGGNVETSYSTSVPVTLSAERQNRRFADHTEAEVAVLFKDFEDEESDFSEATASGSIEQTLRRPGDQRDQYSVKDDTSDDHSHPPERESGYGSNGFFSQMREIFLFAGPALGIWLSGPLMSIIDTAVVGNSSSLELAALGPGTVLCDTTCFVFMFLSIATSNLIATALAKRDEAEAARQLSRLLFVALFCGVGMMFTLEVFVTPLLQGWFPQIGFLVSENRDVRDGCAVLAFVGIKNYSLIPVARQYIQIRALAWPVVLAGMVAQSASLGMQDSWAPLESLAIASSVNLFGDILLCTFLGYGIGGAAWATMVSQYIGAFLMLKSLKDKGYNPLAIVVPSTVELASMINIAGPILLTMLSKAGFYTIITFLATSLGSTTLAAHQVMIGIFSLCTVCGEPLAQTAQSFMPAFIYGSKRNLKQARALLYNLMLIGAFTGIILGSIAVCIPWFCPQIFTSDAAVVAQMRAISVPFFVSLIMLPVALCCEGTLLAGRDLKFLGFSMASCFCGGTLILVALHRHEVGLIGSWWTLVAFQMTRFIQSYMRLAGAKSFLADNPSRLDSEAYMQLT